jgi:GTP cyclohydrolase I
VILSSLVAALNDRFPFVGAASWDPVGLQVGSPEADVGSVAVCHEVTERIVATVIDRRVTTVITYHPLLFTPTVRIVSGQTPEGRVLRLASGGVSVVVIHTAMDTATPGTADFTIESLGWTTSGSFGAVEEGGLDIGRVATLDGETTAGDLAALLSNRLGGAVRVADAGRSIGSVAVLPGSGASYLDDAARHADAIITGDVSHHRAVAARDAGLSILDVGHSATELAGVGALYAAVREVIPSAIHLADDATPWEVTTWNS